MDDLFDGAEEALSGLLRGEDASAAAIPVRDGVGNAPRIDDDIEIELARVPFNDEQLASARVGTIFSLNRPTDPAVTLYRGGEKVAEGTLLVRGGKLAVAIKTVFSKE